MESEPNRPKTGLLLSGGMDSAILLDQLLSHGWQVVPFYVRTACVWQACELGAIEHFLADLEQPALNPLVTFDMPLNDLYGDHWSLSGTGAPDESSSDEAVYLPGRNPLLLIKPVLWCRLNGIGNLAMATLANNPFRDATPEFFARFEEMIKAAADGQVHISRPFEHLTKNDVLELGRHLPLQHTFSCLAPVAGLHCGHCNKCAERRRAFHAMDIYDPTEYAEAVTSITSRREAAE